MPLADGSVWNDIITNTQYGRDIKSARVRTGAAALVPVRLYNRTNGKLGPMRAGTVPDRGAASARSFASAGRVADCNDSSGHLTPKVETGSRRVDSICTIVRPVVRCQQQPSNRRTEGPEGFPQKQSTA